MQESVEKRTTRLGTVRQSRKLSTRLSGGERGRGEHRAWLFDGAAGRDPIDGAYLVLMSESLKLTAVFSPDEDGWTMAQLAEWPAVVTCGRTVDEAREMLLDAAREMIISYREQGHDLRSVAGTPSR